MGTIEDKKLETINKYVSIAHKYIAKEGCYDLIKYAKAQEATSFNFSKWIAFAKDNLSKEDYEKFIEKALPLEPKSDGSDKEEKEALKAKVIEVSQKVFQQKAGLFEIYDEITPYISKYMYMVKQLRFTYKEIASYVFNKNLEYCEKVDRYNHPSITYGLKIISLSDEENKMLEKMVEDRGMLLNDITYVEAYKHAQRKGLIKSNQNKSR